jgi:transcriptional regulator with XRE-family HTH domain
MKRKDLLKSKEYWVVKIQNDLYNIIENYMKENKLNRTQLAEKLNVTKGYITQVLNGDFDHKLSKLVELALLCNSAPLLHFVDMENFIRDDAQGMVYQFMPMARPSNVTFATVQTDMPGQKNGEPERQLVPKKKKPAKLKSTKNKSVHTL